MKEANLLATNHALHRELSNFWSHEIDTSDPSGQCSARGSVESTDSHCNALVVIKVSFSSCQRNLIKTFQIEGMITLITKTTLIFSSDLLNGQK